MFNLVNKKLITLSYLGGLGVGFFASSSWATTPVAAEAISPPVQIVEIEQGWVREAPPTVTLTAAYMRITNLTDNTLVLIGGSSPDFATVEIHQTVFVAGIAKMVPQEQLPILPHQSIELKPKGLHVMLIDRQRPLRAGDSVNLTLLFKDSAKQTVTLEVKTAGVNGGISHHH